MVAVPSIVHILPFQRHTVTGGLTEIPNTVTELRHCAS
jgi:hypothetical protein